MGSLLLVVILRDARIVGVLIKENPQFWNCSLSDEPVREFEEFVKRLYPRTFMFGDKT